jgi:hypothetical protein
MKYQKKLQQLLSQELHNTVSAAIWKNKNGSYEVFGRYTIETAAAGYRVCCNQDPVGTFSSTRTAISWCIADRCQAYNTARQLLSLDHRVAELAQDIQARLAISDRSGNPGLKEIIVTKLESKILQKKLLENQLNKCVNWTKYCQQRGFNNETARTGRDQPNKTSRQGF